MNDAEFRLHGEIEEDHWWFVGKRLIPRALFEPEVEQERVVRRAGLIPKRITYTNFWVFPVAAVWRLVSYRLGVGRFAPRTHFWKLPRPLNRLLVGIYRLEARLLRHLNLPVGVSALCVARKPGAPGS
jgi:hypothetical protein